MERLEKYEGGDPQRTMRFFTWWVLFSQMLGLLAVILVAVWMGVYRGGFAWTDNPGKEFNYHPLFMTIGLIFLYGDAILVYRVFRNDRKVYVKVLHAVLHMFALIFVVVGLKAVFDSHNLVPQPMPNMYSLHSWLGLTAVLLFSLQWVFGFISFLYPGVRMDLRGAYKPVHVFWGLVIFIAAIASALMGITEKTIFSVPGSGLTPERLLINSLGLIMVALGIVVTYIVTKPDYARQPTPDEEHIQLTQ